MTNLSANIHKNIVNCVGNTPLIELKNITKNRIPKNVRVFAKMECFNPGGSVKDRPALRMILKGEEQKLLTKDKTIIDATSGNTGIAIAMLSAYKGYKTKLVMPQNISSERKVILHAFGAKCIFSDPLDGSDGAITLSKEIINQDPNKYFCPDQYNNPENWKAHYYGTAEEIIKQTNGELTHFLAAVGTSGTIIGNSKRLKEFNPNIRTFAIQPAEPFHGLEGLKHIESSIMPGIYDIAFEKQSIFVGTEESYSMVKDIAIKEGLFVGLSSGAALTGVFKLAQTLNKGYIVTIFPDNGEKYFSSKIWKPAKNTVYHKPKNNSSKTKKKTYVKVNS